MRNQYRINLTGPSLYREIELSRQMSALSVGTTQACDIRLPREQYFTPVVLYFSCSNDEWSVSCCDEIYLSTGDSRKFMSTALRHGNKFEIHYQDSDVFILNLEFLIDFDTGEVEYRRRIDLSGVNQVTLGQSAQAQIRLNSSFAQKENVELVRNGKSWKATIYSTAYGIDLNGHKVTQKSFPLFAGDFLSVGDFFFYMSEDCLIGEIRPDLVVSTLPVSEEIRLHDYPRFNRSTRIRSGVCEEPIEVLDPANLPEKPKNNLFMRLLPSVGMLLAAGVMASMGGSMIVMSAVSGSVAIVTAVYGYRTSNKDYKEAIAHRRQSYLDYMSRKKEEIAEAREKEFIELEKIYIPLSMEKKRFDRFSTKLFDRLPEDEDFLVVRLGTGSIRSRRPVKYRRQERLEADDELQVMPAKLAAEAEYLPEAPVVLDLKIKNAIGIVGSDGSRFEMMKTLLVDLFARQFSGDVKLFLIAEPEHADAISWLRFLPYIREDMREGNGSLRYLVSDGDSRNLIFEYLYKELSARQENKTKTPHLLVLFYDEYGFKSHPLSRFVPCAKELGVTFLFFGRESSDLPLYCDSIISLKNEKEAVLLSTESRNDQIAFFYPSIPDYEMKQIVDLLAPVYTEQISLEGTLTKNISLFELLGIYAVEDISLEANWRASRVYQSMSVPLGVSKTGIVELDLHDKGDGPHGLVAGTTGSGKSEILQTYILSTAIRFDPYEVSFVIIDFKGGGMVNQFADLPHLRGAITNIDGKAINRSLKSIRAELAKRQRRFKEAGVNHIDKYIQKYQAGEASEPLPHLVIIVDEFAELKAEQPDFMKELISAARIGRSLGVHLILATQKPSGQVDDQIWSNSRFKLCLKVQSQADSNEVLKSPLAAEIKEPGRAYLQVGNNERFELFQSAYSGASKNMDGSNEKEFTIYQLGSAGRRTPVFKKKKSKGDAHAQTQLEAVVGYVHDRFEKMGKRQLDDICLPQLERRIFYRPDDLAFDQQSTIVEIGLFDDPDHQLQDVYEIDLSRGNVMIIGSSNSGKTNLLQTMIRAIAQKYTPEEVNIYIIDFASRFLKNFDGLAHVGGVVTSSEDEKLKNLFKLLYGAIEERKEKMTAAGVSSFTAYREAGYRDLPLIVLMIDNLSALRELYLMDQDDLLGICREGLSAGICVVIANSTTSMIGYKYLSNFSNRIALFCNDSSAYSDLFEHCRQTIENIPGRALVEISKEHLDAQSYLSFEGEREIDRARAIAAFIDEQNERCAGLSARRIPLIPSTLTCGLLEEEYAHIFSQPCQSIAGLDYASVAPHVIDFSTLGLLGISGKEQSGKTNWIKSQIHLIETFYPGQAEVYICDGFSKKLEELRTLECVKGYSMMIEDAEKYIDSMEAELAERYRQLSSGNEQALEDKPTLILVLHNPDAAAMLSTKKAVVDKIKVMIDRYRKMKAAILLSVDNQPIAYGSPELLKLLRDHPQYIFFDDLARLKLTDLPMKLLRIHAKAVETGDGYFISEGSVAKLKTPLDSKAII